MEIKTGWMTPEEHKAHVELLDAIEPQYPFITAFEDHVVRKPFDWSDIPKGYNLAVVNSDFGYYLIVEKVERKMGMKDEPVLIVKLIDGEMLTLKGDVWELAVRP